MIENFYDLSNVLAWSKTSNSEITSLHERYVDALCHGLGSKLAKVEIYKPDLVQKVHERLALLTDKELVQFLLKPDTSRRIVTDLHCLEDVVDYLASDQQAPSGNCECSGKRYHLLGNIPIKPENLEGLDFVELQERINHLIDLVVLECDPIGYFLRSNMRELVLCRDINKKGFFSNSPQGYVGRAVLTNGHLPIVDEVMLVEAIVHEATHGFVGMSEAIGLTGVEASTAWLTDSQPYDGKSRVKSPWTGTPLDIPTYLHACFVWWGLLNLWVRLREVSIFDQMRVRNRLERALSGFRKGALIKELEPYRNIVAVELMTVLEDISQVVQQLLDAGVSDQRS